MKTTLLRCLWMTICLLSGAGMQLLAQNIDFGKSYVNLTKGLNGGTIEPGDTLEIRAVFVVRSGVYDSCAYFDNIPVGTSFVPGSIRVLTNEGKIYKQFSDAPFDDEGWITGSSIRINLGYSQADAPARSFRRGRIRNTHKPSFYGSSCIMVASYRVVITAPMGSIVNTGGGSMSYRNGTALLTTYFFPFNALVVYTNIGMCPNLVGANSIGTEFNGSFGSGRDRNRVASTNVPPSYTYSIFNTGTPNDYSYGIANNTSTRVNYTTLNTWAKPDNSTPTHRVFGVWDIIGDHTGAASLSLGNPAADTVNNANGGYMLVVNASYRIDSAFQQTISGLCPNTYYEISCWVRNICSKCGCDSNGKGATNSSTTPAPYIPTVSGPPGSADSSGVYPNLTFEVDGLDYYTTGNIRYTGTWVKKGFTFRTGPTQSSIVLKFFNNAPGGGGNDWALDDITVATCMPNLTVNPTPFYTACENNLVDFGATVRSFFSNYNQYKWQRSTDGGTTWNDVGISGTAIPTLVSGQYQYTVSYPTFVATMADSGQRYRIVVGTTIANLSNANCASAGGNDFTTLNIIECTILPARLRKFTGITARNEARLHWVTEHEDGPVEFLIERSTDGIHFQQAGTMSGRYQQGASNMYQFTDPRPVGGPTFYRLTMVPESGASARSQVILLHPPSGEFRVKVLQNPFRDKWRLSIDIPSRGRLQLQLSDITGKSVSTREISVESGSLTIEEQARQLTPGVYLLQLRFGTETRHLQLVKTN
jgi:trimeric autotransporter adhesin